MKTVNPPPNTRRALIDRWLERREALAKYGALVDGARLLSECINDVEALFSGDTEEELSLTQAAQYSGYSEDHIGRLIRSGALPNVGRKHRPRVRRADLPRKPSALRESAPPSLFTSSRRQIAMSVVNSQSRSHDDKGI